MFFSYFFKPNFFGDGYSEKKNKVSRNVKDRRGTWYFSGSEEMCIIAEGGEVGDSGAAGDKNLHGVTKIL